MDLRKLKTLIDLVSENGVAEIDSFGIIKDFNELKRGDVDLNGNVTSADARLALRYAVDLDKLTGNSLITADVDENGVVNTSDARRILRAAVNLEPFEDPYIRSSSIKKSAS